MDAASGSKIAVSPTIRELETEGPLAVTHRDDLSHHDEHLLTLATLPVQDL